MLKILDLFSGIGGFSYGLEATGGFQTGAFVEINPFCQQVLKKHWPAIPIYSDVKSISLRPNLIDVICGGFPCQDVSTAAGTNQQSLLGERSGLWFEYLRLITEGKPTWVVIENVENLLNQGLTLILQQLAEIGYDAEWNIIRACDVGLPHIRKRVWIVAHNNSNRIQGGSPFPLQGLRGLPWGENVGRAANWLQRPDTPDNRLCRSSNGIPNYMDRIKALGNSVIPFIPYRIGNAILEYEKEKE